jgi:hypothetical protein
MTGEVIGKECETGQIYYNWITYKDHQTPLEFESQNGLMKSRFGV